MGSNHQQSLNGGVQEKFRHFAHGASHFVGTPWMFILACLIIVAWAVTGPLFGYSDSWQLVINTGTTIVTFLMVFLIQNTQNRDARAMHLKLDELIRALKGARNQLVNLEEMSDEELDRLQAEFNRVCGARQQRVEKQSTEAAKPSHERGESIRRVHSSGLRQGD